MIEDEYGQKSKAYYYNHTLIAVNSLFILWRRFNDCAFQNINSEWLLCKFVLAHIPDLISKSTTSAKLLEKKMARYLSNTFTSEGRSFKAEWSQNTLNQEHSSFPIINIYFACSFYGFCWYNTKSRWKAFISVAFFKEI